MILHVSLRTRDWIAGTVVIAALVLLAVGAGPEGTRNEQWMHWATLVATFLLFGLGLVLMRVLHKHIASATGLVAGAMFGVMAVASRVLHGLSPFSATHLLTDRRSTDSPSVASSASICSPLRCKPDRSTVPPPHSSSARR